MRWLQLFFIVMWLCTSVTAHPAQIDQRLEAARQLMEADPREGTKKLKELERELEEYLAGSANDAGAWHQLGQIRFYLEDDAGALKAFSRAVESAPEVAKHHFMRGVVLRFTGRSEAAIESLTTATKLDPSNVRYLMELAQELLNAQQIAQASAAAEKALELDPQNADAMFIIGVSRHEAGDDAGALEMYRKAVAADPNHLQSLYNIGQACQAMGNADESLAAFEQVVRLQPEDWRARAKVIQNLQALGRLEERDEQRRKLFELHKDGKIDAEFYCREQFSEGDVRVMAFEYFQLAGPRAVRYSFQVLPPDKDEPLYRVSLGSYDSTVEVARELGEIKPDQRLFHLDGYFPDEHRTYAHFDDEPGYDETRELVVQVIQGKATVLSSSRRTKGEPR